MSKPTKAKVRKPKKPAKRITVFKSLTFRSYPDMYKSEIRDARKLAKWLNEIADWAEAQDASR